MSKKTLPANDETEKQQSTTATTMDGKRRKAVTKIAATTGIVASMSGNWVKPVLTSAVLPAHAGTTCNDGFQSKDGDCLDG